MADSDRRRAAATAATGYALVGAGGALRGHAIDDAHATLGLTHRLKPPAGAVYSAHQLRVPGRARILRRFGLGTALVTVGAPAAAKGTYDLIRRRHDNVVKAAPTVTRAHQLAVSFARKGDVDAQRRALALRNRLLGPATRRSPIGQRGHLTVAKRRRPLVVEGVTGTGEALHDKTESLRSGAPAKVRAVPVAVGGASAFAGSLATHRLLDALARRGRVVHPSGRAALTAVAAVPSALATLPVSRRITRRSGYQVTPTGVRKDAEIHDLAARRGRPRPHTPPVDEPQQWRRCRKGSCVNWAKKAEPTGLCVGCKAKLGLLPYGVRKALRQTYDPPDYRGRHTPVGRQRAAIYSAGAIPFGIGAIAGAQVAGAYAPPGKERHTAARQFAAGPGAGTVAGVAAAHQLARRSETSPLVRDTTRDVHRAGQYVAGRVRSVLPQHAPGPRMARAAEAAGKVRSAVKDAKVLKPFFGTPERAIASAVGYSVVKPIVGQAGGSWAMRRNRTDQRRYNAHHPIEKAAMSQRERDQLARRKRINAATSTIGGMTGLTALGLLAAAKHPRLAPQATRLEHHRNSLLAVAAGVGGAGSLNFAGIQRREARADQHPQRPIVVSRKAVLDQERRNQPRSELIKYDRIRTDMHEHEARRLTRQYGGLQGPLPPGLSRDEKMRAYEARYVASGGRKVQRWQRRAEGAEVTRNAGLVGGALSGAAWMAAGSTRGRAAGRMVAAHVPKLRRVRATHVRHAAERTAVGAATLGATAELAGEYARARRGRYTTAPGGVAASALRRMRDYTPQEDR